MLVNKTMGNNELEQELLYHFDYYSQATIMLKAEMKKVFTEDKVDEILENVDIVTNGAIKVSKKNADELIKAIIKHWQTKTNVLLSVRSLE